MLTRDQFQRQNQNRLETNMRRYVKQFDERRGSMGEDVFKQIDILG